MRGFPSHCVAEVPSVEACGVPVKERVRGQGGQMPNAHQQLTTINQQLTTILQDACL
ncbi:hypothetical protein [Tolypothrix sp. VBCCA 56010]|uniref:hypothetical protein n=1 Tax=Tolypothrix sp. VBCCA 56010 TaxID=3137731 RepID=UPI003D7EE034